MGNFERYLSVWVALAIVAGIALGQVLPGVFGALAGFEYANVNFAVAVLIWAMVWPMMIGVDFSSLARAGEKPKGLIITLVVNWLIKPFTNCPLAIVSMGVTISQESSSGFTLEIVVVEVVPLWLKRIDSERISLTCKSKNSGRINEDRGWLKSLAKPLSTA